MSVDDFLGASFMDEDEGEEVSVYSTSPRNLNIIRALG